MLAICGIATLPLVREAIMHGKNPDPALVVLVLMVFLITRLASRPVGSRASNRQTEAPAPWLVREEGWTNRDSQLSEQPSLLWCRTV